MRLNIAVYFIQNLSIGDYEIRYHAPGYDDSRSFFFTVTNRSTDSLRVYLSNTSLTTLYLVRTVDQVDNDVVKARVRLQRQYVEFNGQFVTIEECFLLNECFFEISI